MAWLCQRTATCEVLVDIPDLIKWLEVVWSPAARAICGQSHLSTVLSFDLLPLECLRKFWELILTCSHLYLPKRQRLVCARYQILAKYCQSCHGLGMPFSHKYHSFLFLTADFCHTAKLWLSFAACSLRTLCLWVLLLEQKSQSSARSKSTYIHPFFSRPLDWLQNTATVC